MILVLDGLNEQHIRSDWRRLLEALSIEPWQSKVCVMLTCRTSYWKRFSIASSAVTEYQLPPYSERELDRALSNFSLLRSDLPNDLLPVIRKPRYLDLMVKHREKMAQSGDITITRLIYEDWKDRARRKNHLEDLNNSEFQDLIRGLADKHLEQSESFLEDDIEKSLPVGIDSRIILNELRTGNILYGEGTRLRVDKRYLVYGLGLLLVDELAKALNAGESLSETLASWIEPESDIDIKAEICSFSFLHALQDGSIARQIKVLLLEAWISNRNSPAESGHDFIAYMPQDIQVYIDLAERVWSSERDNRWIQELVLTGFLKWRNDKAISTVLPRISEKWLGFVHLYGFSWQRGRDEKRVPEVREKINRRVEIQLEPGVFDFAGLSFTATVDDGLLRLGNLALAIISHLPRKPFIHAIAIGNVAEAIMGNPGRYELYQWILSTASDSVWKEVNSDFQQLLAEDTTVTKRAAHRLLSYEGSLQAKKLQDTLPGDLFKKMHIHLLHEDDPCTSGFAWGVKKRVDCLQREDVTAWVKISRIEGSKYDPDFELPEVFQSQLIDEIDEINKDELSSVLVTTRADLLLERYEPAICRFAPHKVAELMKSVVSNIESRSGVALTSLSLSLRKYALLFDDKEQEAIYRAWLTLSPDKPPIDDLDRDAELFLFERVLEALSGELQLVHMLYRHQERHDLARYSPKFRALQNTRTVFQGLKLARDNNIIKRTLLFLRYQTNVEEPQLLMEAIYPLLSSDYSSIRALVLENLFYHSEPKHIMRFLDDAWAWKPSFNYFENHWGSLLICEHGADLAISAVFERSHPSYWGTAIRRRSYNTQEILQFANGIDLLLLTISSDTVDVPSDLPLVEIEGNLDEEQDLSLLHRLRLSQRQNPTAISFFIGPHSSWGGVDDDPITQLRDLETQQSNEWYRANLDTIRKIQQSQSDSKNPVFHSRFSPGGLKHMWDQYPDTVKGWLDAAMSGTASADQLLRRTHSVYQALCEALLEVAPDEGLRLFRHLRSCKHIPIFVDANTGIDLLDFALFNATATDETGAAWQDHIDGCSS